MTLQRRPKDLTGDFVLITIPTGNALGGYDLRLRPGKIPLEMLKKLVNRYRGVNDLRVIIGPNIGLDAGAIAFGRKALVASSDPVTLAQEEIGWYAVHINANDVAVMGARPRWFLADVLLPEGKANAEDIFKQVDRACRELSATVVGGHTEVTIGLDRPIVIGTMLGEVPKDRLLSSADARVGDRIVLTKGIAIEGTAILAQEKGEELARAFGLKFVRRARRYLYNPGISIVREAMIAARMGAHAMHDPTEGGLLGGLYEMMMASGVGVELAEDDVPIFSESKKAAAHFRLDIFRLIASGCLVVAASARIARRLIKEYERQGIAAAEVGRFTRRGFSVLRGGKRIFLPRGSIGEDEIVKVLGY